MVFKYKRGEPKLTWCAQVSLLGKFVFKNSRLAVLAGIGLRFDQLTMNRKEPYIGLLGFSAYPEDSISLKKIRN